MYYRFGNHMIYTANRFFIDCNIFPIIQSDQITNNIDFNNRYQCLFTKLAPRIIEWD